MEFWEWFCENLYSNCFTVITVIFSGIISWVISAIYYHKGNRTNLKISVILPLADVLQDIYSSDNYGRLCKISYEYSVKYMNKEEEKVLADIKEAYKNICLYNKGMVNAEILLAYFKERLKANDIEFEPIPIIVADEIVDCEPPKGMWELLDSLVSIFNRYDPNYEPKECQEAIIKLFTEHCRENYPLKKITYFDDVSFENVLKQSKITAEWNAKFKAMNDVRVRFLNLKIVKDALS